MKATHHPFLPFGWPSPLALGAALLFFVAALFAFLPAPVCSCFSVVLGVGGGAPADKQATKEARKPRRAKAEQAATKRPAVRRNPKA